MMQTTYNPTMTGGTKEFGLNPPPKNPRQRNFFNMCNQDTCLKSLDRFLVYFLGEVFRLFPF